AANMADESDTETVTLGSVVPPAGIPTLGEWARIFIPLLLLAVGVIVSRRRRGMIAMIIASAFLVTVPAHIANAAVTPHQKTAKADKIRNEVVTIDSVGMKDRLVTLHLADGREFTVDTHNLQIKDKSVTGKDRKTQHQAGKASRNAVVTTSGVKESKNKVHGNITPQALAERIQKNALSAQSRASGQAAIVTLKHEHGEIRMMKVNLYRDLAQANSILAQKEASKALAQSTKKTANH